MAQGNPQGKGLVPVLAAWQAHRPTTVRPKPARELVGDYFASALVLTAEFGFRPVPGVRYHLYLREDRWRLSLVAPDEWRHRDPGRYLGACELRPDMTWRVDPIPAAAEDPVLSAALAAFHRAFRDRLNAHDTLEDSLPHYAAELPFHRRLLAAGLAASLDRSLQLAGLKGHDRADWQELIDGGSRLIEDRLGCRPGRRRLN
jgi:hypothetical protein